MALNARQMASCRDSHIGGIDARALLVVTVVYLVAMLSVPVHSVGMLIWFAVYPIVSAPLAHIAYERLFVKSLYVLPLLVIIGVFNPVYDHRTAFMAGSVAVSMGWVSFVSVIIRGLLSVQALLLLVYLAGFNGMCGALRAMKVPKVLVTQLQMLYRYLILLLREALDMHRARISRGYGRTSYGLSMWGSFVGQLMLRTFDRSERIHKCMLSRGFNGFLPTAEPQKWHAADTLYCLVWILVFVPLRFADLSALLLQLINRT